MFLFSRLPLPLPPRTRTTTAPPPAPAAGEGEGREGRGRGRQQEGHLGGREEGEEEQEEGRVSSGGYLFICSFKITSTSIAYIFLLFQGLCRKPDHRCHHQLCVQHAAGSEEEKRVYFFG